MIKYFYAEGCGACSEVNELPQFVEKIDVSTLKDIDGYNKVNTPTLKVGAFNFEGPQGINEMINVIKWVRNQKE